MMKDFVVLTVDMRNTYNLVSCRQAILYECASFFPELLPWALWCYGGAHSALWHPSGRLSSESGVQHAGGSIFWH